MLYIYHDLPKDPRFITLDGKPLKPRLHERILSNQLTLSAITLSAAVATEFLIRGAGMAATTALSGTLASALFMGINTAKANQCQKRFLGHAADKVIDKSPEKLTPLDGKDTYGLLVNTLLSCKTANTDMLLTGLSVALVPVAGVSLALPAVFAASAAYNVINCSRYTKLLAHEWALVNKPEAERQMHLDKVQKDFNKKSWTSWLPTPQPVGAREAATVSSPPQATII